MATFDVGRNSMSRTDWPKPIQKLYRQRWRIWIVAVLADATTLFHRTAMAPVADRVMADFNVSAVAFGGLSAVYFYVYAAMQIPSGILADTMGPRKMLTAGLILLTLGSLIMSTAPLFGLLFLGRVMVGFGASVIWLNILKVLTEWFHAREMATMTGLSGAVVQLGPIAATTPLALLIIWGGWRMSFISIGVVTFALAIANWLIVRDSPAQVGLPPIPKREAQHVVQGVSPGDSADLSLARRFKIAFGNKHLWPSFMLAFGTLGAYTTLFQNWVVVYVMQTYDVQRDFATNFVLAATIGMIVGAPVAGFLSDRILQKRRLPAMIGTGSLLTSLLILALWNGGRPPLGALYPLCFFMALGLAATLINFARVRDIVQPSIRGIAFGLVNTGALLGAAVAQPLFGYILDLGWEGEMVEGARLYPLGAFQQGFLLCCVFAALSFLGALLIKETNPREIYSVQG